MLKVTTSWDDGDVLDKRLADLLTKYGFKGTFYITKNYRENRLSESEIKDLSTKHEIGAHTLTHPDLRNLSVHELENEIAGSKKWLEEVIGKTVTMFCYPKGLHDESTIAAVKKAGFLGARSTELGMITAANNPFQIGTTLQVYPFPFRKVSATRFYWRKILEPFLQRSDALKEIGVPFTSMSSWLSVARTTFNKALENGEVFHLWGHSWEIEKYNMWQDLEKFLQYVSSKQGYTHVTNSELLS